MTPSGVKKSEKTKFMATIALSCDPEAPSRYCAMTAFASSAPASPAADTIRGLMRPILSTRPSMIAQYTTERAPDIPIIIKDVCVVMPRIS